MKKNKKNELASQAANDLVAKISNEVNFLFSPRYTENDKNKMIQTNPYANFSPIERTKIVEESAIMTLAQFLAVGVTEGQDAKDFSVATNEAVRKLMLYIEGYVKQINKMKKDEAKNGPPAS